MKNSEKVQEFRKKLLCEIGKISEELQSNDNYSTDDLWFLLSLNYDCITHKIKTEGEKD